jgi:transposase
MALETVGSYPTDRGKNGSKRHLTVDGLGVPLPLIVTGATRHDAWQLAAVLDAVVLVQPRKDKPYLYADKGYDGQPAQEVITSRGYGPRVNRKKRRRGRPWKNRRWVVEVIHAWFNRFRKFLVRYEKFADSYEALLHLAAAIIRWTKVAPLYG